MNAIWRYPVKSMAGESLAALRLEPDGIVGDRRVVVVSADGRVLTSRSKPRLLGHRASLGPDGEPLVDGRPWDSVDVDAAAGTGAQLVRAEGGDGFDILPLLVVTDGALREFGRDLRRLRPNLVIGGVEGLEERTWEGRRIQVGDAVIALRDLRERCIMTTFDPDTQEQDVEVLRDIRRRFGGKLGLNAWVEKPGRIAVGDRVDLLPSISGV